MEDADLDYRGLCNDDGSMAGQQYAVDTPNAIECGGREAGRELNKWWEKLTK
jgi:hypothetical protein